MNLQLQDCSIWILGHGQKEDILLKYGNRFLNHRKIFTLDEVRKKYYFDYDDRAVYFLMNEYGYQYDVAKMYLSHLIFVEGADCFSDKILRLRKMKEKLDEKHLLIYHSFFRNYLKNKNIAVFGKDHIFRFDQRMLDEIGKNSNMYYFEEESFVYQHDYIVSCDSLEDEVSYVASCIAKLIYQGIDIRKIKVCASSEYENAIVRIFQWFHIPTDFCRHSLFTTEIGQDFLRNMSHDKGESLSFIEKKYSLKDSKYLDIYNLIVDILNRYVWCNDLVCIKDFLVNDFKHCSVRKNENVNCVKVIHSLDFVLDDEYVFLVGFNQGEIPKTFLDEDYFNQSDRELLDLDTIDSLNLRSYSLWLKMIRCIQNLTITMKKNGSQGECYLSSLNDDLGLEVVPYQECYEYSNLYNQLKLCEKLDVLVKYQEVDQNLGMLYYHYPDIHYHDYDNRYTPIDQKRIHDYLHHQLYLSYSSMNVYYLCPFRYYLSYVLRINPYEETFFTILGKVYHHVLACYFSSCDTIDVSYVYDEFLSHVTYHFNSRELFFLKRLKEELQYIISVIVSQNQGNLLSVVYTEKEIEIDKSIDDMKVIFKGYVDKMFLNDQLNHVAIVDYKTGNPDLNLNHIIYGLDLQLPVYVYLSLYQFPDARIVGFYLQNILNTEIVKDYQHSYDELKRDKLKLQGYSNQDLSILRCFDPFYEDSKMIKGMKTNSKGIASKKVFDDVFIQQLYHITDEKINEAIGSICHGDFSISPKKIGMELRGCAFCHFRDVCFMTEKDIVHLKEYKNMEFMGGDINDTEETN